MSMKIAVLLFDEFETLDVFGPVEVFGCLKGLFQIKFYSENGGIVKNSHGVLIQTQNLNEIENEVDIFLIPGGYGTRVEVENENLLKAIRSIDKISKNVFTVCTGSALLAKTGLLDGKVATSNKKAFDWVMTQGDKVLWKRKARWTKDGKYYTSGGVSAGIDMSLAFLQEKYGLDFARNTAFGIEYNWIEDMEEDNFYSEYLK